MAMHKLIHHLPQQKPLHLQQYTCPESLGAFANSLNNVSNYAQRLSVPYKDPKTGSVEYKSLDSVLHMQSTIISYGTTCQTRLKQAAAIYILGDPVFQRANAGLLSILQNVFDKSSFPDLCSKVYAAHALQQLNILLYNRTQQKQIIMSKQLNDLTSRITTCATTLLLSKPESKGISVRFTSFLIS